MENGLDGQRPGLAGEVVLIRPEQGGGVRHPGGKAGADALQNRDHLMSDTVAGKALVGVGVVLHMGQAVVGQILLHLPPGGGEQGADQAVPGRLDACQPTESGTPGQVE